MTKLTKGWLDSLVWELLQTDPKQPITKKHDDAVQRITDKLREARIAELDLPYALGLIDPDYYKKRIKKLREKI